MIPANAAERLTWIRSALATNIAIPRDELLLVRDLEGRAFRPAGPPKGMIPRTGAVLILLYPDGNDLRLPLTVRSQTVANHRGEVSLPGGATDPGDDGPVATALRECSEELGVAPEAVTPLGTFSPTYILPSNFEITPVVGYIKTPPEIQVNLAEVSAVITTSLSELLDPTQIITERWTLRGTDVQVPFFPIDGQKVWGATALILSEFAARLRHTRTAS